MIPIRLAAPDGYASPSKLERSPRAPGSGARRKATTTSTAAAIDTAAHSDRVTCRACVNATFAAASSAAPAPSGASRAATATAPPSVSSAAFRAASGTPAGAAWPSERGRSRSRCCPAPQCRARRRARSWSPRCPRPRPRAGPARRRRCVSIPSVNTGDIPASTASKRAMIAPTPSPTTRRDRDEADRRQHQPPAITNAGWTAARAPARRTSRRRSCADQGSIHSPAASGRQAEDELQVLPDDDVGPERHQRGEQVRRQRRRRRPASGTAPDRSADRPAAAAGGRRRSPSAESRGRPTAAAASPEAALRVHLQPVDHRQHRRQRQRRAARGPAASRVGSRYSGSKIGPATSSSAITGTASRKTEPQWKYCSITPPSSGPIAPPTE